MAQIHAQKKKTSPGRVFGGVIFSLFAIAAICLAVLVYIFYLSKQNSLPWVLNAVLLSIVALVFIVVSIVLFAPAYPSAGHNGPKHCPKCGYNLHQRYSMRARCPNSQCDKVLGPEDFDAHFCTSCGTNVLQAISQITGQFPVIQKSSSQSSSKQPGTP